MPHHPHPARLCARGFAEQFLIWTLRQAVAERAGAGSAHSLLAEALSVAQAEEAAAPLAALLDLLLLHGRRPPYVHAPRCAVVSADEDGLCAAVAAGQHGTAPLVGRADIFAALLPPSAARLARTEAAALGAEFVRAGLWLPRPAWGEDLGPRFCARPPARPMLLH